MGKFKGSSMATENWVDAPDPIFNERLKDHRKNCLIAQHIGMIEFDKLSEKMSKNYTPNEIKAFHDGIHLFCSTICKHCRENNNDWDNLKSEFPQYFDNGERKELENHNTGESDLLSRLEFYLFGRHNV
jgi:hypothetical protein